MMVEAEPVVAAEVFGADIDRARRFAAALAEQGESRGLIGPAEPERLWSRHLLNCAVVAPLLKSGGRVGDIGSGAGLPGLVLAIARPDVEFVLIEPMERRVEWLREQVALLDLGNVAIVRARAQEAAETGPLDQVTARAVSALRKLVPMAAPLVRAGGELVFMKGAAAAAEVEAASAVLRRHDVHGVEILTLGEGVLDAVTRVVRATVGRSEKMQESSR